MQGRYGVDDFSRFIMGVALTLIILTMVVTMFNRNVGSILDFLGIAAIVYAYFRIFSRNIQQRYAENQKYLQVSAKSAPVFHISHGVLCKAHSKKNGTCQNL